MHQMILDLTLITKDHCLGSTNMTWINDLTYANILNAKDLCILVYSKLLGSLVRNYI